MKEKRPNILFYFTDQQRWDTAGCYGQPLEVTPNLDELAKEGVVFEDAFTAHLSVDHVEHYFRQEDIQRSWGALKMQSHCLWM